VHFGRVVGTVVATQKTPGLRGHRLLVVSPTTADGEDTGGAALVAVDLVSAGPGDRIFYVRSREAANALPDPRNPVDATILGIVDSVTRGTGTPAGG